MNYNRLRPYTALTMGIFLILLAITGWILYLAPQGPGSRYWSFLGIEKHLYKDIHLCLGVVASLLVLLHGYLNMKALTSYLSPAHKAGIYPLLCALMVLCITVLVALSL